MGGVGGRRECPHASYPIGSGITSAGISFIGSGQYCPFRKMLIRILQVLFGKVVMVQKLRVDYTLHHDAEGVAQRPIQS